MEVIHIPSGGVEINGVVYVAAGAGPHPVLVLCHGLPGNEKNLDLAQAVRRAGWTVVTFNYRGSWGSPGEYRFTQDLEDADAVLDYIRQPGVAAKLDIDPRRVAMAGHSLGGWVTSKTAAHHPELLGAALVSFGDMSQLGRIPRDQAIAAMADNGMEALAGTSPAIMADEAAAHVADFDMMRDAPALTRLPMLILSSDDGGTAGAAALTAAIEHAGGKRVQHVHATTDHGWSDARIRLADLMIGWLKSLPR
jgi:pimeloyl-ACP methyl ester carboxylesterase